MYNMMNKIKTNIVVVMGLLALIFVGGLNIPSASAAPMINFNATSVCVNNGVTQVGGYFINTGDQGSVVNTADMIVVIYNEDGAEIWRDSATFQGVNVFVGPGMQIMHQFNIHNSNCSAISGRYKWNVKTKLLF